MTLRIKHFFHPDSYTLSYVVSDDVSQVCAIIDPALDYDPVASEVNTLFADQLIDFISQQQLTMLYILETHAHADHISSTNFI